MEDINAAFQWKCRPQAEALILNVLAEACQKNKSIDALSNDLLKHTSTRLFDWLDHITLHYTDSLERELEARGFVVQNTTQTYRIYHHPGAQLPRIVVKDDPRPIIEIAVTVESIADFLMVRGLSRTIEGSILSGYRRCVIDTENNVSLLAVERRGVEILEPIFEDAAYLRRYLEAKEKWQTRPRTFNDQDDQIFSHTLKLAEDIVKIVGQEIAAWIVLDCERSYWQAKNTAGQIQKNRQDRLGMGWANHDHHTFRSSRKHFVQLVRLFEILGFHCRERFYAGKEAGWGAQVMENSKCHLVLFLDVDLQPDEIGVDFAHHPLPDKPKLGTIGLWCALHGDSILKAGMHHLEAQFMFDELKKDLAHAGVGMMDPFSSFPYLKQAFTQGEVWQVEPQIIQHLLESGKLSHEQAEKFLRYGAVGSHLENLQRREGYKGFNQKNVSIIIQKTDPRLIASG